MHTHKKQMWDLPAPAVGVWLCSVESKQEEGTGCSDRGFSPSCLAAMLPSPPDLEQYPHRFPPHPKDSGEGQGKSKTGKEDRGSGATVTSDTAAGQTPHHRDHNKLLWTKYFSVSPAWGSLYALSLTRPSPSPFPSHCLARPVSIFKIGLKWGKKPHQMSVSKLYKDTIV